MKKCIHSFVVACWLGVGLSVAHGQSCDLPGNPPPPCRQIQVATIPSSALDNTIFVTQVDNDYPENCQDNSYSWDVLVCVNAPNATSPISLELVMPHGLTAIRHLEIRGTMPQAPLRLTIRGVNGLNGPPQNDYFNAVVQEMVINPTAQVHVELTAYLSDVGRIECHAIRDLVFLDDTRANAGPRCGPGLQKVIGLLANPPGQTSRILVRNNPNLAPPPFAITGIVNADGLSARTHLSQCVDFRTSVIVENGPVVLWNFPANWKLNSPEFKATNATNGNFNIVRAGQIGPTASGARVQMQAQNIDTLTTSAGGTYSDIVANTIDSMGGNGIVAQQGLSGSITANTVTAGSQIRFSNPGPLNGVAPGSLIRLNALPAGAVIDLPSNGLQRQIILNASDATPAGNGWLGDIRVGGQIIPHSGAQYTPDVSTGTHGGGSIGLTRFARHNTDCSPLSGGLRTLAAFFSGTNPVIIEYYGPVRDLDSDTTRPPVRIEWVDLSNTTYDLTDPAMVAMAGGEFFQVQVSGRRVLISPAPGRQQLGFPLGTFTVTPLAGNLVCDQLLGIAPDVDPAPYTFIIQPACASGNQPSLVRDCNDNGVIDQCETPVPPCTNCRTDFDGNGALDPDDLADFIGLFFESTPRLGPGHYAVTGFWPNFLGYQADYDGNQTVDPDDLADYIAAYFTGC